MVFITNAGSQLVRPGPEDEFQGENELLGLKGWQLHRIKFLPAHDLRDGVRKDNNVCTARVCRVMVLVGEHSPLFSFAVSFGPDQSLGCHSWRQFVLLLHWGVTGASESSSSCCGNCWCRHVWEPEGFPCSTACSPSSLRVPWGISRYWDWEIGLIWIIPSQSAPRKVGTCSCWAQPSSVTSVPCALIPSWARLQRHCCNVQWRNKSYPALHLSVFSLKNKGQALGKGWNSILLAQQCITEGLNNLGVNMLCWNLEELLPSLPQTGCAFKWGKEPLFPP